MGRPVVPLMVRFWRHTAIRPDGCWVWTGHVKKGAPVFADWDQVTRTQEARSSRRLALALFENPWLPVYDPHRSRRVRACERDPRCVNPQHLGCRDS